MIRLSKLASIPLRLGVGLGVVALSYAFNAWIVAIALALTCLLAVGVLAGTWMASRAVRARRRVNCSKCRYRPLRIARVCPRCGTPVLLRVSLQDAPGLEAAVLEAAITMAWADGEIGLLEREHLESFLGDAGLPADETIRLRDLVARGLEADQVCFPQTTDSKQAHAILSVAAAMLMADHRATASETAAFMTLARALGIEPKKARKLLRKFETWLAA